MAVEAEFFSENLGFSQDYITSIPNLSPPLQQQGMGMGMGMGFNVNQGIVCNPCSSSINVTESNIMPCLAFPQPFSALLEKHKHEVDLYLHIQGERLKEAVKQHKRQQMQLIINSYESRSKALMREKEEDLEKLRVKTKLLEEYLKKAVEETEAWQRIAREKEETVIELNNMLLMVQQNLSLVSQQNIVNNNNIISGENEENDVESVCDCESLIGGVGEERESEETEKKLFGCKCKWCNDGSFCVVFLPCKHLCCCKVCEPLLGLCPVCHSVKQGSLEIFFS